MLDIEEIKKLIPHRYPFLLVDRILEFEIGKRIVGLKNVTNNEPFFQGHFPGRPIMPGVQIVEALAQTGGCLFFLTKPELRGRQFFFASLENVRFRRPVVPGDSMKLEVEFTVMRSRLMKMKGRAVVDGEVATEADMTAMIMENNLPA